MRDVTAEEIWTAVEAAVIDGWTVEKFLREAQEAWRQATLRAATQDRVKQDAQRWVELLATKVRNQ